mmetsp:Transcript_1482/g.1308  ORF Transcript_1482/g.1308 Transcript_1482/m.1308 type:complete len:290 (-) Transcript_1482:40-909(-)
MGNKHSNKNKPNKSSHVSAPPLPIATPVNQRLNDNNPNDDISIYLSKIKIFAVTSLDYEKKFKKLGLISIDIIADQLMVEGINEEILQLFDNKFDLIYFLQALVNDKYISDDIATDLKIRYNNINGFVSNKEVNDNINLSFNVEIIIKGNELIKQKGEYSLFTALQNTANKDTSVIANYIISLNNSIINKIDASGHYPIHRAAGMGLVDVVKYILSIDNKQINIITKDTYNGKYSPLTYAALTNQTEVVKLLLTYKDIDINIKSYGKTALEWARSNGNNEMIFYLINFK